MSINIHVSVCLFVSTLTQSVCVTFVIIVICVSTLMNVCQFVCVHFHPHHRCQHHRKKKWDKADKKAGKPASMRRMHTEAPSSICFTARVCNWYCSIPGSYNSDLARAKITVDIFNLSYVGARVDAALYPKQANHTT